VQIPPIDEARALVLLAALDPTHAQAHRARAVALLTPVAHRSGNHRKLLDVATHPGLPLPPL
jgi:hypothetical protein